MFASSVEIANCADSVTSAVAKPIVDGAKEVQAVAIPTRIGCVCRAHNRGCVTAWLAAPIMPIDAANAVILQLRATANGRKRLRRELPAAVHRMVSVGEWQHVAALCRRFPLGVATVVENTDKWGGDAAAISLQALRDFAIAGVLGPATLEKAMPTAMAERFTCAAAQHVVRVQLYAECLLQKPGGRKDLVRVLCRCPGIPTDVWALVAAAATAPAKPARPRET